MVIRIDNPDISQSEKTHLSSRAPDGVTALTVDNNEGFSANDFIVIGNPGEEKSEHLQVSSLTGDHSITTTAGVKHDHPRGTPIYYIHFDQYSLEVKPSGGSYSVISGMPLDLEWDQLFSEYIHGGETTDTYRFRLYNSHTGAYSSYAPEIAGTGHTKNSVRFMTDRVLLLAKDPEAKVASRENILDMFNAAQDFVAAEFDKPWFLWKEGVAIPSVASEPQYAFPTDMDKLDNIIVHFDDGSSSVRYALDMLTNIEYEYEARDQNANDDDDVNFYTVFPEDSTYSNGSFKVWPVPENANHNFYPQYWRKLTTLEDDNDETDISLPQVLEYWALSEIERIRGNEEKAKSYLSFRANGDIDPRSMVGQNVNSLRRWEKKKRATGHPRGFMYRGRKALHRFYGERRVYSDSDRENYW